MALRKVLHFPNPNLKIVATPVEEITTDVQTLIDDMLETMYADEGCGLAATQIDVHQRIVVMDLSRNNSEPRCFINPEILSHEGSVLRNEACLSVPGVYDKVKRAETVKARYLDREGNTHEVEADGLLAHCLQHEIDHLNGILFIDHLSPLKRQRIEKKLKKIQGIQY